MDLFKRNNTIPEQQQLPAIFVTVVDPDGAELPSRPWCVFKLFVSFSQLVTPAEDGQIAIIAVPDEPAALEAVRLVAEHGTLCGVQIVRVDNATDYAISADAQVSFWQCPLVDFIEWGAEADEAAREAELARRASKDKDELRLEDNARKGGGYKRVDVKLTSRQVGGTDGEEDEAPVL